MENKIQSLLGGHRPREQCCKCGPILREGQAWQPWYQGKNKYPAHCCREFGSSAVYHVWDIVNVYASFIWGIIRKTTLLQQCMDRGSDYGCPMSWKKPTGSVIEGKRFGIRRREGVASVVRCYKCIASCHHTRYVFLAVLLKSGGHSKQKCAYVCVFDIHTGTYIHNGINCHTRYVRVRI